MSGRRKFSELTEHFTPKDRKIVEEKKAKMRASLKRPSKPSESPKAPPQTQVRRSRAARGR